MKPFSQFFFIFSVGLAASSIIVAGPASSRIKEEGVSHHLNSIEEEQRHYWNRAIMNTLTTDDLQALIFYVQKKTPKKKLAQAEVIKILAYYFINNLIDIQEDPQLNNQLFIIFQTITSSDRIVQTAKSSIYPI